MQRLPCKSHGLLEALASGDDARAGQLLRELLGTVDGEPDYTSIGLPPGVTTAKHFHRILASGVIAGACKIGRGHWSCPRAAWHEARDRRPEPRLHAARRSDEQLADLALAGGARNDH